MIDPPPSTLLETEPLPPGSSPAELVDQWADLSFDLEAHPAFPFQTTDDCVRHALKQLEGTDIKVSFRNATPDQRDKYKETGVAAFMEQPIS